MKPFNKVLISLLFLPLLTFSPPHNSPETALTALFGRSSILIPKTEEKPDIEALLFLTEPDPNETDIFFLINYYAREYGVDFELAFQLAKVESGFDYLAENPKSSAVGIYQFLTKDFPNKLSTWSTYCEGDPKNAKDNVKCAMKLIGGGGISHWLADERTKKAIEDYL